MNRYPTHAEVAEVVARIEPATAEDARREVGAPWEWRTTIRNRLEDLVAAGELIVDEGRPRQYAINQLERDAVDDDAGEAAEERWYALHDGWVQ